MGDMGDLWQAYRASVGRHKQMVGEKRRQSATRQYDRAAEVAREGGVEFLKHSETHYQLRFESGEVIDIYPGSRRISQTKGKRIYLKLGDTSDGWMVAVAVAAVEAFPRDRIRVEAPAF